MGFCLHNRKGVLSRTIPLSNTQRTNLLFLLFTVKFAPVYVCKKVPSLIFSSCAYFFSVFFYACEQTFYAPFFFFRLAF